MTPGSIANSTSTALLRQQFEFLAESAVSWETDAM